MRSMKWLLICLITACGIEESRVAGPTHVPSAPQETVEQEVPKPATDGDIFQTDGDIFQNGGNTDYLSPREIPNLIPRSGKVYDFDLESILDEKERLERIYPIRYATDLENYV